MKSVIVQRVGEQEEKDLTEIKHLSRSAGYSIEDEIHQSRSEDIDFNIGRGKVQEVHQSVITNDADVVIFDNKLTPRQRYNLGLYFETNIEVYDKYSLILQLFQKRATTKKSQLQVKLAELRYELPRVDEKQHLAQKEEKPGFMGLGEYDKNQKEDIKSQIHRIKNRVERIKEEKNERYDHRKELGFDIVSIAGYTNAGKSTLMKRLASDLDLDEDIHRDLHETAEVSDDFFTTLDTTVRKMDIEKRDVLLTDTVGLIQDIPDWLLESFESTLYSVYNADLVLLVIDGTDSENEIRSKVETCKKIILRDSYATILPVINKADELSNEKIQEKKQLLSEISTKPVVISAETGYNIDILKHKIEDELPNLENKRMTLPLSPNSMSIVSDIYDNAFVEKTEYNENQIEIQFKGKKQIVSKLTTKCEEIL